jgi:TolB protein
MNSDGGDSSKLTDNTLERIYYTAWSPDGTKIAFIAKKDDETNIFVINPDGSDLVQITHLQDMDPHWVSWIPSIDLPDTPIPVSIGK